MLQRASVKDIFSLSRYVHLSIVRYVLISDRVNPIYEGHLGRTEDWLKHVADNKPGLTNALDSNRGRRKKIISAETRALSTPQHQHRTSLRTRGEDRGEGRRMKKKNHASPLSETTQKPHYPFSECRMSCNTFIPQYIPFIPRFAARTLILVLGADEIPPTTSSYTVEIHPYWYCNPRRRRFDLLVCTHIINRFCTCTVCALYTHTAHEHFGLNARLYRAVHYFIISHATVSLLSCAFESF